MSDPPSTFALLTLVKGDEVVEAGEVLPDEALFLKLRNHHFCSREGRPRNGNDLNSLHERDQLVVVCGTVEVVPKVSRGIFAKWAERHRVEPRDHLELSDTPQLRTLADRFVLRRVGNYDIAVPQSVT